MKTAFVCIAFAVAGLPALAQDVTGLWETGTNGAEVEIAPCGPDICGTLVTSNAIKANADAKDAENNDPALRDRPLKGLTMLSGFSGGPEKWTGGKLYNPADGKTYSGTMTLAGDKLTTSGCVLGGLICRSVVWNRAN